MVYIAEKHSSTRKKVSPLMEFSLCIPFKNVLFIVHQGKWVLVNRGWVGKVILLWFNFILGLNFVSLCSTQNKEKENLNQG